MRNLLPIQDEAVSRVRRRRRPEPDPGPRGASIHCRQERDGSGGRDRRERLGCPERSARSPKSPGAGSHREDRCRPSLEVDRWGRSSLDVHSNIRALETCGVRFVAVSQGLDVRPGSDAMSHLILGVLASVAEFEREIIRERTRLGLSKARKSGKLLGRPSAKLSPAKAEQVRALRSQGRSWSQVAEQVRCSVWAARCCVVEVGSENSSA